MQQQKDAARYLNGQKYTNEKNVRFVRSVRHMYAIMVLSDNGGEIHGTSRFLSVHMVRGVR